MRISHIVALDIGSGLLVSDFACGLRILLRRINAHLSSVFVILYVFPARTTDVGDIGIGSGICDVRFVHQALREQRGFAKAAEAAPKLASAPPMFSATSAACFNQTG